MKLIKYIKYLLLLPINKNLYCIEIKQLYINSEKDRIVNTFPKENITNKDNNLTNKLSSCLRPLNILSIRLNYLVNRGPLIHIGFDRIQLFKGINFTFLTNFYNIDYKKLNDIKPKFGAEIEIKRSSLILLNNISNNDYYGGGAFKFNNILGVVAAMNLNKNLIYYANINLLSFIRIEAGEKKINEINDKIFNLVIKLKKQIEIVVDIRNIINCNYKNIELIIKNKETSNISRLQDLMIIPSTYSVIQKNNEDSNISDLQTINPSLLTKQVSDMEEQSQGTKQCSEVMNQGQHKEEDLSMLLSEPISIINYDSDDNEQNHEKFEYDNCDRDNLELSGEEPHFEVDSSSDISILSDSMVISSEFDDNESVHFINNNTAERNKTTSEKEWKADEDNQCKKSQDTYYYTENIEEEDKKHCIIQDVSPKSDSNEFNLTAEIPSERAINHTKRRPIVGANSSVTFTNYVSAPQHQQQLINPKGAIQGSKTFPTIQAGRWPQQTLNHSGNMVVENYRRSTIIQKGHNQTLNTPVNTSLHSHYEHGISQCSKTFPTIQAGRWPQQTLNHSGNMVVENYRRSTIIQKGHNQTLNTPVNTSLHSHYEHGISQGSKTFPTIQAGRWPQQTLNHSGYFGSYNMVVENYRRSTIIQKGHNQTLNTPVNTSLHSHYEHGISQSGGSGYFVNKSRMTPRFTGNSPLPPQSNIFGTPPISSSGQLVERKVEFPRRRKIQPTRQKQISGNMGIIKKITDLFDGKMFCNS